MSSFTESQMIPVIEAVNIGKRYGNTVALDDISLKIMPGTIHGLLGENGAGKSTFIKILAGVTQPDEGSIFFKGRKLKIQKPKEAVSLGLISVFQELSLVPELSVAEALFLDNLPRTGLGNIDYKKLNNSARSLLSSYGFEKINTKELIKDHPLADRQIVEIIKCLNLSPEILFMDEGTSTLSAKEVAAVFSFLRILKKQGKSVVFISHRMSEIQDICDVYTVFRDGKNMGTFNKGSISDDQLIGLMVGEKSFVHLRKKRKKNETMILEIKNLGWENALKDISLNIKKGEIFGIGGLNGQGQMELLYSLFGVLKSTTGEVYLGNKKVRINNPSEAISGKIRLALIPEDRKTEGGILEMTVLENMSIAAICSGTKRNNKTLKNDIETVVRKLNIKTAGLNSQLSSLSGGNQQKVIIGKWLMTDADIYIFHDPTRGIDIKAKHDIYSLIEELAEKGKSVILFSTELQELVWLCDRVAILYENSIRKIFDEEDISEKNIVEASLAMDKQGA